MEFDNLQIEIPINDESSPMFAAKIFEKKYKNKKDFVVGFNPNDEEFLERKKRRAQRFGKRSQLEDVGNDGSDSENTAPETTAPPPEKVSFTALDENFFKTVNLKELKWPPVFDCALDEMRLDAIHLYGVDHMSTKDIFKYFDLFGPDTLEWIDDSSCNVIWEDEATVSKVMDNMSKTYSMIKELQKGDSKEDVIDTRSDIIGVSIKVEQDVIDVDADNDATIDDKDDDDIDPKDVWRLGYPNNEFQLFLRPATVNDKKLPGAASRSEYYLLYGKNENKKKTPGVLSKSKKRKLEDMKKRANEVYKLKEPDVKLVALEDLAKEGIVNSMDVDDEPQVKRMNYQSDDEDSVGKSRTMIADRLEMSRRLGNRGDDRYGDGGDTRVHDRLGFPDDDSHDDPSRANDLRKRLNNNKSNVHDRLGRCGRREKSEEQEDARGEIERSKRSQANTKRSYKETGYEKDGVYHDIYRADDIKEETPEPPARGRRSHMDDENDDRRANIKSRLGNVSNSDSDNRSGDLRNKLRHRGGNDANENRDKNKDKNKDKNEKRAMKEEPDEAEEANRLNLCIEVKQEPELDYDDDYEMQEAFEF